MSAIAVNGWLLIAHSAPVWTRGEASVKSPFSPGRELGGPRTRPAKEVGLLSRQGEFVIQGPLGSCQSAGDQLALRYIFALSLARFYIVIYNMAKVPPRGYFVLMAR